jgi:hypothetical protein
VIAEWWCAVRAVEREIADLLQPDQLRPSLGDLLRQSGGPLRKVIGRDLREDRLGRGQEVLRSRGKRNRQPVGRRCRGSG